jgi:hypothetical protein
MMRASSRRMYFLCATYTGQDYKGSSEHTHMVSQSAGARAFPLEHYSICVRSASMDIVVRCARDRDRDLISTYIALTYLTVLGMHACMHMV